VANNVCLPSGCSAMSVIVMISFIDFAERLIIPYRSRYLGERVRECWCASVVERLHQSRRRFLICRVRPLARLSGSVEDWESLSPDCSLSERGPYLLLTHAPVGWSHRHSV
jgi:hypothetical protein